MPYETYKNYAIDVNFCVRDSDKQFLISHFKNFKDYINTPYIGINGVPVGFNTIEECKEWIDKQSR